MDDIGILKARVAQLDEEIEQIYQALLQFDDLDDDDQLIRDIEKAYYEKMTHQDIVFRVCKRLGAHGKVFKSKEVVDHAPDIGQVHVFLHRLKNKGQLERVSWGRWRLIEEVES